MLCKDLARQHGHIVNVQDAFNHLWIMSDPIIRRQDPKFEETQATVSPFDDFSAKNEDDLIVESFILP